MMVVHLGRTSFAVLHVANTRVFNLFGQPKNPGSRNVCWWFPQIDAENGLQCIATRHIIRNHMPPVCL